MGNRTSDASFIKWQIELMNMLPAEPKHDGVTVSDLLDRLRGVQPDISPRIGETLELALQRRDNNLRRNIQRTLQLMVESPEWGSKILCRTMGPAGLEEFEPEYEEVVDKKTGALREVQKSPRKTLYYKWRDTNTSSLLEPLRESHALALLMLQKRLSDELPPSILECLTPLFEKAARRLESMGSESANPVLMWKRKVANISANQYRTPARPHPKVQTEVLTALYNNNQLQLKYPDASNKQEWVAHPLGVLLRGPVIYLVCYINESSKAYMLPLHRIQSALEIPHSKANVRGFNLAHFIESGQADFIDFEIVSGLEIELVADFDTELARSLTETPLTKNQKIVSVNETTSRLTAKLQDTLQLRWWLLGYGSRVTVVRPQKIRMWIADEHRKAAKLYPD